MVLGTGTCLHDKLKGRQLYLPVASYIALHASNSEHYFVSFQDGKIDNNLPEQLEAVVCSKM